MMQPKRCSWRASSIFLVFYLIAYLQGIYVDAFQLLHDHRHYSRHTPRKCFTVQSRSADSNDNAQQENSGGYDATINIMLSDLLRPDSSCDASQMGGTDLAYIGDVVFEMFVRMRKVWPSRKTSVLQHQVVECVRAENQSRLLAQLKDQFPLSAQEQQVLARGRNAVAKSSKNRRDPAIYQDSTSFECLLGYLYIADTERCRELLVWIGRNLEVIEEQK